MTENVNMVGVDALLRELASQVLAVMARRYRDFAAAEDAVQEALLAAAVQWVAGLPENPRGWLIQVASRRMTDALRSEGARRVREAAVSLEHGYAVLAELDEVAERDDTLALMFLCCHPALSRGSAIALTLRAVGGLTTAEIARAFLVPEATMAQRISRAKQAIQSAGARFVTPSREERAGRLGAVLHVLYLIFNEGYTASAGASLQRSDLAAEAVRLARVVHGLLPEEPEVAGLLALLLLTDARRRARTGVSGEAIPLDRQDRGLWDRGQIAEGVALVSAALRRGAVGPYQLQAAIAAVHDEAARAEDTDWAQILGLYDLLLRVADSPVVRLNRAVAAAMVHGPAHGLELVVGLERELKGNHRVEAVRGHLREMAGDREGAIADYLKAAQRTGSLPERNYLLGQAARLWEG
ncbi:MAG: RNA polymerase sigma factor [Acidobacteria bacterium]|nr:RNA polymerase sigma factor [Acidobacteriota bacterium]